MSHSALIAGLRRLRGKLAAPRQDDDSDEQLVQAFATSRDESAFATLLRRHGPMVLHVCRRVLGHEQDAEDAFQATFLVLARNASSLRKKSALASFLHGTAYRLALSAKRAAARRRKHEGEALERRSFNPAAELSWREVRELLDAEIARLPEKHRSIVILCCLEELSQADVARRLGVNERTVSNRLAVARERLGQRLARRGVELTAVPSVIDLASTPGSALPPILLASTIKAAVTMQTAGVPASFVSASVADLVQGATPAVLLHKTKSAAALLLAMRLLAGAGVWTYRAFLRSQISEKSVETPQSQATSAPRQTGPSVETFTYSGIVRRPDGKPLAGAKIHIHGLNIHVIEFRERTVSGADGKFRFHVRRDEFSDKGVVPPGASPPERYVCIAATADGYGGASVGAGKADERENLTLWLPEEEIVRGRVINLEGRGVAGVNVSASIRYMRTTEDHKPLPYDAPDKAGQYSGNVLPCDKTNAVTDKDGRFVIRGLSRGWLYDLYINGPTVVNAKAQLVARPVKPSVVDATGVAPPGRPSPRLPRYGSTFTFVAVPSKPIVGVVRDKESGRPLQGIEIRRPWTRDDDPWASTTTDKNGRYKLLGLPGGIHTLRVEPPGNTPYLTTEVWVVADQPGIARVTFDISLQRQPTVHGRVIDRAAGKPVSAWIEYRPLASNPNLKANTDLAEPKWPINHPPSVATDGEGRFTLPVLRGRGVLLVRANDRYLPAQLDKADRNAKITDSSDPELIDCRPLPAWPGDFNAYRLIDVAQEKETRVEIRLAPGISRPLMVEFPDGKSRDTAVLGLKPLANAHGDAYNRGKSIILGLAEDEVRRLFLSTYDSRLAATATVSGKEKGSVTVKLKPTGTITGQVVDKDGKPIAGVGFRLLYDDGPGRPGVYIHGGYAQRMHTALESRRAFRTKGFSDDKIGSRMEHTDEQGRFHLPDIVPEIAFDLQAVLVAPPNKKGQSFVIGEVKLARPTVKPGETLDLGTLRVIAPPKKS
jgi:RNA polymerase sigma factor (sigma-70 family)